MRYERGRRRRRRVTGRFFVILALLLITVLLAVLVLFRLDGGDNPDAEQQGSFLDNFLSKTPEPQLTPQPTPEPTPTPVPAYSPAAVEGTRPTNFGLETGIEVDGKQVSTYQRETPIDFLEGDKYTQLEGVITFRGNNFRDAASYGTATINEAKFDTAPWTFTVGSLKKVYNSGAGGGSWTGVGWTGQPLLVRWPDATKRVMNMYDWAKTKKDLVEAIYATMDGNIYFLDIDNGEQTRPPIKLGFPFKGAGALDPRGYPLMFVGSGDDSPSQGSGSSRAFILSLVDGSVLYEFGMKDDFSLRGLSYFDSAPLVDAETDTLLWPGESGIFYTIKLNTAYDEGAGTLSIDPGPTAKWNYSGKRSNTAGVDGSTGWWLGVEDSIIVWRGHAIFTDNGGHMICLDLNTFEVAWVQDTLDDTNCTPVLVLEGEDKHPYLYTSTSFHGGWRKKVTDMAEIPIWKIDALTGEIVWSTSYNCQTISGVSGGVQGSLVSGKGELEDLVFVPVAMTEGTKGKLVALNKADGREVWVCDFAGYPWSSPVAIYDQNGKGYIVQCNKTGYIHLIDGKTGVILDEMSLGSNIEASPAIFDNTVVVGTRGGLIYGVKIK